MNNAFDKIFAPMIGALNREQRKLEIQINGLINDSDCCEKCGHPLDEADLGFAHEFGYQHDYRLVCKNPQCEECV